MYNTVLKVGSDGLDNGALNDSRMDQTKSQLQSMYVLPVLYNDSVEFPYSKEHGAYFVASILKFWSSSGKCHYKRQVYLATRNSCTVEIKAT